MAIRAKYVGPDYLNNVPACDLDEDEYRDLTNEQREAVRESGNYEVLTDREYAESVRVPRRGGRSSSQPSSAMEEEPQPEAEEPVTEVEPERQDDGSDPDARS